MDGRMWGGKSVGVIGKEWVEEENLFGNDDDDGDKGGCGIGES